MPCPRRGHHLCHPLLSTYSLPAPSERKVLVLYLFLLLCLSVCLRFPHALSDRQTDRQTHTHTHTHTLSHLCFPPQPGVVSLKSLTCFVAPNKKSHSVCASAQGTLCHQREPAPPPRWSFLYPSTVIQATLVRNRNLVFLPLYGTPSEGTLHFEIQLGPVTPVSVPPWCGGGLSVLHKHICGSQGACSLCRIRLMPLTLCTFFQDLPTPSSLNTVSSRLKTCLLGYVAGISWNLVIQFILPEHLSLFFFSYRALASCLNPGPGGEPLFSPAGLPPTLSLPSYCSFLTQKILGICILSCLSPNVSKVHKEKYWLKYDSDTRFFSWRGIY